MYIYIFILYIYITRNQATFVGISTYTRVKRFGLFISLVRKFVKIELSSCDRSSVTFGN